MGSERLPGPAAGEIDKSLANLLGDLRWDGRPAAWPFLLDSMSLFLLLAGGLLLAVAVASVGWWLAAVRAVESWGTQAVLRAVLGPVAVLVLFGLAVGIPGQLIAANRRARRRLRYLIGEHGLSIGMDDKSFNLRREKIRGVRAARSWWPGGEVCLEIDTENDWKSSGAYHQINENFAITRVPDRPMLYFVPRDVADRLIREFNP